MEKIINKKEALILMEYLRIKRALGFNGAKNKAFLVETDMREKWLQKKLTVIKLKITYIPEKDELIQKFEFCFFDNYKKYHLDKEGSKVSYHYCYIYDSPYNDFEFKQVINKLFKDEYDKALKNALGIH